MYETSFRLQRRPFAATPDSRCFFESESRTAVIRDLVSVVEGERGTGILIGAVGLGKTAILIQLAERIREKFTVFRISAHGISSARSLLQAILYELGERYTGLDEQECRLELRSCLKRLARSPKPAVLLVDEGEQLTSPLFAELRGCIEEVEAGRSLLRLIVAGQPPLEDHLLAPETAGFNQRVATQQYLAPFSPQESAAYVAYRLAWAGSGDQELFTPEAMQLVVKISDGVPRCLNQLCDHALLLAFVVEAPQVGRKQVEEALSDLKQLPLHWNTAGMSAADTTASPSENEVADPLPPPDPLTNAAAFEFGAEPPAQTLTATISPDQVTTIHHAAIPEAVAAADSQAAVTVTTNVTPADLLPACEVDEVIAARLEAFSAERTLGDMHIATSNALPSGEEWSLPSSNFGLAPSAVVDDQESVTGTDEPIVDVASRSPWVPPTDRPQPDFQEEAIDDRWSQTASADSLGAEPTSDAVEPMDRIESATTYSEPITAEAWSLTMDSESPSILTMSSPSTPSNSSEATFEPRNTNRGFSAETIFDRYASLDAGRTDLPPVTATPPVREEQQSTLSGPRLFADRPDLATGAILNLVASIDGDDTQGFANSTRPDTQSQLVAELDSDASAGGEDDSTAHPWDEDLEHTILQTSEQLLAEVRSKFPQSPAAVDTLDAASAEYDVVEPSLNVPAGQNFVAASSGGTAAEIDDFDSLEADLPPRIALAHSPAEIMVRREGPADPSCPELDAEADSAEPDSQPEPETLFSPYKRLFSLLRRKHRRSA